MKSKLITELTPILKEIKASPYGASPHTLTLFFNKLLLLGPKKFDNIQTWQEKDYDILKDILTVYLIHGHMLSMLDSRYVENLQPLFIRIQDFISSKKTKKITPQPIWARWRTNETFQPPTTSNTITIFLYESIRQYQLSGGATSGHVAMRVNNTYLSFNAGSSVLPSPNPILTTILNARAQVLHRPKVQKRNPELTDQATDLGGIGTRYTQVLEVNIDCRYKPGLDAEAAERAARALLEQPPDFDFWNFNCSHACAKVLAAANQDKSWIPPHKITPRGIYESLLPLARENTKARLEQITKNDILWKDIFYHFSSQSLAAINLKYARHHFKATKCILTIPDNSQDWFPFEAGTRPYEKIDQFIKHIQILALALSRKDNISLDLVKIFIDKVKEFALTYEDEEVSDILMGLTPFTDKIGLDQGGLMGRSALRDLRRKLYCLFAPKIQPSLFTEILTPPSTASLYTSADSSDTDDLSDVDLISKSNSFAKSLSQKYSPRLLSAPNTPLSSQQSAPVPESASASRPEEIKFTPSNQVSAFFMANGFKEFFSKKEYEIYNDFSIDWLLVLQSNPTVDHLDKLFKSIYKGLGNSQLQNFDQLVSARYGLRQIYHLQHQWKNACEKDLTLKAIPGKFYMDCRNILRSSLQSGIKAIYFNDPVLANDVGCCFGLAANNQINCNIETELGQAINRLRIPHINVTPPLWKFWRRSERNKSICYQTSNAVADILANKDLVPEVKGIHISNIIKHNQPWTFWGSNSRKHHQELAKKAELVLILQNFLEGYVEEAEFINELYQYAKDHSMKEVYSMADQFKKKYTSYVENMSPESAKKAVAAEEEFTKAIDQLTLGTRHKWSSRYNMTLSAMRELQKDPTCGQETPRARAEKFVAYKLQACLPRTKYRCN